MAVRNYMQDIIDNEIDDILKDVEMCKCDICMDDVKAIALNNLKPKYYSTHLGEVYNKTSQLSIEFRVGIIKELLIASEIVKINFKHGER